MTTTSSIVRLPADYIPRLEILADTLGVHMSEAITRLIDAELERQGRLDDVPLGEHEFEALGDDGVISWRGSAGTFVWTRKLAAEVAETLDGFADKSLRGQMHLVEAGVIIGRRGSGQWPARSPGFSGAPCAASSPKKKAGSVPALPTRTFQ